MKYFVIICLLMLAGSCDRRSKAKMEKQGFEALSDNYEVAEVDAEMTQVSEISKKPIQRKLIKHGTLTFETNNLAKAKVAIQKLCAQNKAYLGSENQHNDDSRLQNDQEIRVPAENFDNLIHALEMLADRVEHKSIRAEDVTEQFIDIEARLKTKKEVEARYRELLGMAKNVNEMISIEGHIGNVRSEIESMEGQLNYMKSQVSFSTIKLSYFEIIGTDFGFAAKFANSFRHGWDNLLSFLIGIVHVWPFLILISFISWLVSRWKKKRAMVA